MARRKTAMYWCASCGGCEVATLDINEQLLGLAEQLDITFWPIAIDGKFDDVRTAHYDLAVINGAIRNSEQEEVVKLLRDRSDLVVSFGSCACFGGIPGLANLHTAREALDNSYRRSVTDAAGNVLPQETTTVDGKELHLPKIYDTVRSLPDVITVDFIVPGCPPPPHFIAESFPRILTGAVPEGSNLAKDKTLCEECARVQKEKKVIARYYRPQEIVPNETDCLLDQGLICMGPVTRAGCKTRCINANFPCRGCFGPTRAVVDQGAKAVSAFASIYQGDTEQDAARLVKEIADPVGLFYRFTLAASLLRRKK